MRGKKQRHLLDTSQTVGSTRGINKLSTESSSSLQFFITSLPLEIFHPTFSTLISAGRRTVQRVSTFDEFFHVAVFRTPISTCARTSRDEWRKTGTVDEHGSAKIARMTSGFPNGFQSEIYGRFALAWRSPDRFHLS